MTRSNEKFSLLSNWSFVLLNFFRGDNNVWIERRKRTEREREERRKERRKTTDRKREKREEKERKEKIKETRNIFFYTLR